MPPVVNDEGATSIMADAARAASATTAWSRSEQSWGGDSFAWYLDKVPGAYARLGVHDPSSGVPRLDLHAGTFDVDERAIAHGTLVLALAALEALADLR